MMAWIQVLFLIQASKRAQKKMLEKAEARAMMSKVEVITFLNLRAHFQFARKEKEEDQLFISTRRNQSKLKKLNNRKKLSLRRIARVLKNQE